MVMPVSPYDLWLETWEDYFDVTVDREWYDVWGVGHAYREIAGHYGGGYDPDPPGFFDNLPSLSQMIARANASGEPIPLSPARILSERPTEDLLQWLGYWQKYKELIYPTLQIANENGLVDIAVDLNTVLDLAVINEALLALAVKASETLNSSWSKARESQMHDLWNEEALKFGQLIRGETTAIPPV